MKTTSTTALTNQEYRTVKAFSKSDLDLIHKSPALAEWSKNAPQTESEVANIGTATHAALLEPDLFESDYIRMPKFDKHTKAGKEAAAAFAETMQGKIVFSAEDYDLVVAMRDSTLAHPIANKLLTSPGQSETSIFFEMDGVKCKARPDRITEIDGVHYVIDVKTSADVEKFNFSVRDYRYDVQDVFYSEAYKQLTGVKPRFIFVVVGKTKTFGRHPVRVFELDQDSKDAAWLECSNDLEVAKEFEAFGLGIVEVEIISTPKKWK